MDMTSSYRVYILDSQGDVLKDVDGSSTMDAMAYYLSQYAPTPSMKELGATLAAQVRSSWITPDSEYPTEDFVVEERSRVGIEGVRPIIHQFIARVHS